MQCPEHQPIIYILQPSCFYNNLHNHELCRNWWPRTSTILLPFMYFQIFGSIETSFLGTWVITALSLWSFDFLYIIWSLGNCLFNWLFYLSISYVESRWIYILWMQTSVAKNDTKLSFILERKSPTTGLLAVVLDEDDKMAAVDGGWHRHLWSPSPVCLPICIY